MMKIRILIMIILCLGILGCSDHNWTPDQIKGLLKHCEGNGGIKTIITYPGNQKIYSIRCQDGALYKHLDTGVK